jgi:hypothetical protein
MKGEVTDALEAAVDAAAATFDGRGSAIKERELEMALETALRALGLKPKRQLQVRLRGVWSGRVGGVDLAVEDRNGLNLIELKWDPNTLAACAWDSIKLAAALRSREGRRAFLVAGSPISDGLRGDDLLDDGEVHPGQLRKCYAKEFDFWKRDVANHPVSAPSSWRVRCLHSAALNLKGAPWRIRLAELTLTSDELVPFA